MPFCPECRIEYRPGVERCSDCGVRLVESLAEEGKRVGAPLVMLATFSNAAEARLVLELLEHNGIQAVLRGDVDPIGNVIASVAPALLVEQPDLPRAREIYEAFFAGESDRSEPQDGGSTPESPENR